MIISEMTTRIKNIIFFKIIIVLMTIFCLGYFQKNFAKNLFYSEIKKIKAEELLYETQERLNALKKDKATLTDSTKLYHQLKQNENLNIIECFDKNDYDAKVKELAKQYSLSQEPALYASSNSAPKKDQPKGSILVKTTSVNLSYNVNEFSKALNLARASFEALPEYNVIKSISIKKSSTITPELASWLDKGDNYDLISVDLNMEVKEINLNE